MLQTLTNNNNVNNYLNPKKKVLSKWCANNNGNTIVNSITTTSTSIKTDTISPSNCTIPFHVSTPHLSFPSSNRYISNEANSWSVISCDDKYFSTKNLTLSTGLSLTYSREDKSCLESQDSQIILYSSLRYQLKHNFKLTSTNGQQVEEMLMMKVSLEGGSIKDPINKVISSEVVNSYERLFSGESRIQIEKVKSYKQAVKFTLSLHTLGNLERPICVLESVSFNVFARKKQPQDAPSPKAKSKPANGIKRKSEFDSIKPSKQAKTDSFSNSVSFSVTTVPNNLSPFSTPITQNSLRLLADLTLDNEDEEEEEHDLKIVDAEEQEFEQDQKLKQYEHMFKDMISHIKQMKTEEQSVAVKNLFTALQL